MASSSAAHRTLATGKDMTDDKPVPMTRPGVGTKGKSMKVKTNFYRMSAPKLHVIHQYCLFLETRRPVRLGGYGESAESPLVDITPTAYIDFIRNVLKTWWRKYTPNVAYAHDGRKTIYTAEEIATSLESPSDEPNDMRFGLDVDKEGKVRENPQGSTEKVFLRISKVSIINCDKFMDPKKKMDVYEASCVAAAIDTIVAAGPVVTHVPVGRSFYSSHGSASLGEGAEAWTGFYQSARRSVTGVLLNVDMSCTPFWAGGGKPLSDLIDEMRIRFRIGDERGNKRAAKLLYGLKVRATHTNIVYRVHGVSKRTVSDETFFDAQANQQVSVYDYIRQKYNVYLQDRDGLCIVTNPKKKTLMPIEVLDVYAKQRLTRAMTPTQTARMIKVATKRPQERFRGVTEALNSVNHSQDLTCKAFGLRVDREPVYARARVLPAPGVCYDGGRPEGPFKGAWNPRHNRRLLKAIPIHNWVVLNLSGANNGMVAGFTSMLKKKAQEMGINITMANPKIIRKRSDSAQQGLRDLKSLSTEKRSFAQIPGGGMCPLQLILIIMPEVSSSMYRELKRIADVDMGVASQITLFKHVSHPNFMYCANLLLKINAKLGGFNFTPFAQNPNPSLGDPFQKTLHIVLGADVAHPAGGSGPSVAALVGSRNHQCTQFTGSLQNLPPRQEVIPELGGMFLDVYGRWLEDVKKIHGQEYNAQSIIMFRDGVSEGQFQQVMEVELQALRRACATRNPGWNPKITYIIVTKRHHARFFPDRNDDDKKTGNVPPGTVIDTDIVSNEYYDFYINSHAAIQGTNRPSKYTVLIDENKIAPDNLQAYVYRMAHNYVRCNRSVSIVAPVYYAHLFAYRGRLYLNDDGSDTASTTSTESTTPPPAVKIPVKLAKRLFFV